MKVNLTEKNDAIKYRLVNDFKNTKIGADASKDIVKLIAEMVTEAIQLSQENDTDEN